MVEAQLPTSSYLLVLMIFVGLIGAWGRSRFNIELQNSHPEVLDGFGTNSAFGAGMIWTEIKETVFIVRRSYRKLNNYHIAIFGDVVLICYVVDISIFIAWALIPHGPGPSIG